MKAAKNSTEDMATLGKAEKEPEACEFVLSQPEGWSFFYGKQGG
jgi:hypothetical protein